MTTFLVVYRKQKAGEIADFRCYSYNRAHTLVEAIKSVLCQRGQGQEFELEILLIDDGSDDGTRKLIQQQFPNVSYLYQPNTGVSVARNVGIHQSQGEWLAFLDSDDQWLPDKLLTQVEQLKASGRHFSHTEELWIRNGVRVNPMKKHAKSGGRIYEQCLPLCAISPSSVLMHRSIFDDVGDFDQDLPACEDYDLWLRVCAKFEVDFVTTASLIKFGGHDDQLSRQYWGMDRFRIKALAKMLRSPLRKSLTDREHEKTLLMLLKKITILLNGANKRGNIQLLEECKQQQAHWRNYAREQGINIKRLEAVN